MDKFNLELKAVFKLFITDENYENSNKPTKKIYNFLLILTFYFIVY